MPENGSVQQRIEQLRKELAERPDSTTFVELAELLISEGKHEEAAAVCERSIGFHPDMAEAHVAYGKALVLLGRMEEGLQSLERAHSLRMRDAVILEEIATFLQNVGYPEAAAPYMEKALELSGESSPGGPVQFDDDDERQVTARIPVNPELLAESSQGNGRDDTVLDDTGLAEATAGEESQGWPEWDSHPPPPRDALADDTIADAQSLDDEDDEPPTVYAMNPLAAAEGKEGGPESGQQEPQPTHLDPHSGLAASHDVQPPTVHDDGQHSPWRRESDESVPQQPEPPTMFEGASPQPQKPSPTKFVTSPRGAVEPFLEPEPQPQEPLNYLKVFLVLIPFLIAGLALGGYFAWSKLQQEKIDNLLLQARSSVELDSLLGYGEARITLENLLEQERDPRAEALLAMVDARLHDEYGPNLELARRAEQLLDGLEEKEQNLPAILWARYHLGKRDGLAEEVAAAIGRGTESAELLELQARLYADGENPARASEIVEKALGLAPGRVRSLYFAAELYAKAGKKDRAVQLLDRALGINGMHVRSLLLLAKLYVTEGKQLDRAEKLLQKLVEIPRVTNRRKAQAYLMLAKLAFDDFAREAALARVGAARNLMPDDTAFAMQLASLCLEANEVEQVYKLTENISESDPQWVKAQLLRARADLVAGRPKDGLDKLNSLAGKRVGAAEFLMLRGRLLLELGGWQRAYSDFTSLLARKPDMTEAKAYQVLALLGMDKQRDARALAYKLARSNGDVALVQFARGEVMRARNFRNSAMTAYKKAAGLDPRFWRAFDRLAEMECDRRRWSKCLQWAERAISANPYDYEGHMLAGTSRLELGDTQAALARFRQAVGLAPDRAQAYLGIAKAMLALGNANDAEEAALKAINRKLRNAEAYHVLGRARLAKGRFGKAAWALKKALAQDERNPEILADLGLAYLGMRSLSRAEDAFRKSLRRKSLARAQEGLGRLQAARGRWSEAARSFEKAAWLGRRQGWSKEEVGRMYLEAGHAWVRAGKSKLARARRDYRRAAKFLPGKPEPLYFLATAFDRDDKISAARRFYKKTLKVDPEFAMAWYRLGVLEFDQRRDEQARQALQKFIDLAPEKRRKEMRRARKLLRRLQASKK